MRSNRCKLSECYRFFDIKIFPFCLIYGDEGDKRTRDLALHNLTPSLRRHCEERHTKPVARQTLPEFKAYQLDFHHNFNDTLVSVYISMISYPLSSHGMKYYKQARLQVYNCQRVCSR